MAEMDVDGCRIFYLDEGPKDAPVLLLSHSIGLGLELWVPQAPALSRTFRVIRYDTRGHGRSDAPPGPYTLDRLGRDTLALLDALGADRAHVCGLSLGGLIGMWLGLHAPDRLLRLVLANTAAKVGAAELWEDRIRTAREQGVAAFAAPAATRWFTAGFRERHPETVETFRAMLAGCRTDGYIGCAAVLRDSDLTASVAGIRTPTLVITGAHDTATPPAAGEELRRLIPGARLETLEASHLSNVEASEAFTSVVADFLAG